MKRPRLLVLALTVIFCCPLPAVVRAMNLDEAAKAARESGRPLLIVAGRDTCGNTRAVQGHLQEPALSPALEPYISVSVNVDGPEGRACEEKYGHPGNTLPFVFVVRADGEKLYSHSGILDAGELRNVLESELAKAGRSLSTKETALVKKALEDGRRAKKAGDLGEAVKAILPLKKLGPLGNISCFTGPGLEANQFVTQLTAEGKEMLKKVDEQTADGAASLDAMSTYVKARRAFAALPTLKIELAAAARKYGRRPAFAAALAQAEAFDRVQVAVAAHNTKRAADMLKKIVATWPDTDAAKLATEQLKQFADAAPDAPAAEPSAEKDAKAAYRTWSDTSGKFNLKARLAGVENDKVSLETEDGHKIRVPNRKTERGGPQVLGIAAGKGVRFNEQTEKDSTGNDNGGMEKRAMPPAFLGSRGAEQGMKSPPRSDPEDVQDVHRMDVVVEPVTKLLMLSFAPLIIESEREGSFFLRRLAAEWSSGANRFQRPGERLYLARAGETVVGVCGLNVDPYADDPTVGRVRRLFVTSEHRGKRIGSRLVRSVAAAAQGTFRLLRVRTENPSAGALYEQLGFQRVIGVTDCTHMLALQLA